MTDEKDSHKGMEPGALAESFREMAEDCRADVHALRPTITAVSGLIGRLQEIGLDQVGIELVTYDSLRTLRLVGNPVTSEAAYMLLSIYQARFLVCCFSKDMIALHPDNLNKAGVGKTNLNDGDFLNNRLSYDLSQEEAALSFMTAILQTAAICAIEDELREFDRPVTEKTKLPKPTWKTQ